MGLSSSATVDGAGYDRVLDVAAEDMVRSCT